MMKLNTGGSLNQRFPAGIHQRIQQIYSLFRLQAFDLSTPEGQSKERYRRIALTSASSVFSKAISLGILLISMPLTWNYLGKERFGLWMTVSSLVAYLGFADFGIGNGLLNGISEAYGKRDDTLARRYIASSFFMLMCMAAALVLLLGMVYWWVPWARLFNVESELALREAGPAAAVFCLCFAANLPLMIVQRVQLGYQEGFISNLWQIAGNLLGLGAVVLAIQYRGGLPWLVAGMSGMPVVVTLANWLHYFGRSAPSLRPKARDVDWKTGWDMAKVGWIFLWLQLFAMNWSLTDNLVIAQVLGAPAVAEYAVAQKLFSIPMAAQFLILPLWPAYGEALARKDYAWARKTLNRALTYTLLLTLGASLPLFAFARPIVKFWLSSSQTPSFSLMLALTLLNILMIVCGNLSVLLVHGTNLRGQLFFYGAASALALGLKILGAIYFGIAGTVWGTVIGFGLIYTPLALRLAYRTVNQHPESRGATVG